jgi:hypothetical protein
VSANYSSSGSTTISSTSISVSGTGVSGGGCLDSIQRVIIFGIANTYAMYSSFTSLLTVSTSTSTVNVNYIPYFSFGTSAVGINGAGTNVSFIRLA